MKKQNHKKLHQILVIIDDFADDPSFTRSSKLLHALYVRGRHNMISTITSTQKFNAIHPIIRVNAPGNTNIAGAFIQAIRIA